MILFVAICEIFKMQYLTLKNFSQLENKFYF